MLRLPIVLVALVACGSGGPGDADNPGSDFPYEGVWTGYVAGHASFSEDWEETAYCGGDFAMVVDSDGAVTGDGDCEILWGPVAGSNFEATATGSITEDGDVTLQLSFDDGEGTRDFDDATAVGSVVDKLEAIGDSMYSSSFGGGAIQQARVRVTLVAGDQADPDDDPGGGGGGDGGGGV